MVATFMDSAYAAGPDDPEGVELSRPSTAEVASVAALAVRLHLGGAGAPPRAFTWGEAVRRIALLGLLFNAAGALAGLTWLIYVVTRLPALTAGGDFPAGLFYWQSLPVLTGLLWLPAYLYLLSGHWRAAKVWAVAAFLPGAAMAVWRMTTDTYPAPVTDIYGLLFNALPMLALLGFHPTAPRVRAWPWRLALPALVVVEATVTIAVISTTMDDPARWRLLSILTDWAGQLSIAVVAGAIVTLVAAATGRLRSPVWPLTLALLAPAVLGLRLVNLTPYLGTNQVDEPVGPLMAIAVAQCVAVAVAGVALAVVAARGMRRLAVDPADHSRAADALLRSACAVAAKTRPLGHADDH